MRTHHRFLLALAVSVGLPIASCTLITEVDRSLIDQDGGGEGGAGGDPASGGTSTGGAEPTGGSDNLGGGGNGGEPSLGGGGSTS